MTPTQPISIRQSINPPEEHSFTQNIHLTQTVYRNMMDQPKFDQPPSFIPTLSTSALPFSFDRPTTTSISVQPHSFHHTTHPYWMKYHSSWATKSPPLRSYSRHSSTTPYPLRCGVTFPSRPHFTFRDVISSEQDQLRSLDHDKIVHLSTKVPATYGSEQTYCHDLLPNDSGYFSINSSFHNVITPSNHVTSRSSLWPCPSITYLEPSNRPHLRTANNPIISSYSSIPPFLSCCPNIPNFPRSESGRSHGFDFHHDGTYTIPVSHRIGMSSLYPYHYACTCYSHLKLSPHALLLHKCSPSHEISTNIHESRPHRNHQLRNVHPVPDSATFDCNRYQDIRRFDSYKSNHYYITGSNSKYSPHGPSVPIPDSSLRRCFKSTEVTNPYYSDLMIPTVTHCELYPIHPPVSYMNAEKTFPSITRCPNVQPSIPHFHHEIPYKHCLPNGNTNRSSQYLHHDTKQSQSVSPANLLSNPPTSVPHLCRKLPNQEETNYISHDTVTKDVQDSPLKINNTILLSSLLCANVSSDNDNSSTVDTHTAQETIMAETSDKCGNLITTKSNEIKSDEDGSEKEDEHDVDQNCDMNKSNDSKRLRRNYYVFNCIAYELMVRAIRIDRGMDELPPGFRPTSGTENALEVAHWVCGLKRKKWTRLKARLSIIPERTLFRCLTWKNCSLAIVPLEEWEEPVFLAHMVTNDAGVTEHLSLKQTCHRLHTLYQSRRSRCGIPKDACARILTKCSCNDRRRVNSTDITLQSVNYKPNSPLTIPESQ